MIRTPREERRFIRRLKARDERAFTEFVEDHQHRVFNLVLRMLGNREEAEDLSQEVFVTIFKTIGSFREESQLSTWIYRIAINHAKNRLKYLTRRRVNHLQSLQDTPEQDLVDLGQQTVHPEKLVIGHENELMVQQSLLALDEDHRAIVLLRDIEQLSYEEIAQVTGLATGTVKSRLHRARAALKEALAKAENKGHLR